MAELPPLPPRTADTPRGRQLPPRALELPQRAASSAVRPGRPDPRPMRVVYGAGAVAAVSVMAVGLVQPDFGAAADQPPTDGTRSDVATADLPVADGQVQLQPNVEVRHVIRYVHLKPGEQAPPGATVITPDAPAPRIVVTRNQSNNNPPANTASRPNNNPPTATTPNQPAPNSAPRPRTRQSGRP